MRRCSSDCGFHPSVAATTKRQASTAPTPASMLRMKRTWPGTSTNASSRPDGSVGPGEAEVDGQTAGLLLGEAVRVDAGEGQDQGGLAVVDVAGGGDDVHAQPASAPRALATSASSSGSTVRRSSTVAPSCTRADDRRDRGSQEGGVTSPGTRMPAEGISRPGSEPPPGHARTVHRRARAEWRRRGAEQRLDGTSWPWPRSGWHRPPGAGRRGRWRGARRARGPPAAGPGRADAGRSGRPGPGGRR